jgi:transposase
MGEKRVFTKEFKERAVELSNTSERAQAEIARDLGVGMSTLSRWKSEAAQARAEGLRAFPGKGRARDEEMAQLKREVADLRETNEILKKAMAIFTRKNPR